MFKKLLAMLATMALILGLAGVPAAADATLEIPFFQQFVDTDPCTGAPMTVTVRGTARVHDHEGATVVTVDRTITTSTGFEGRGHSTLVINGQVRKLSLRDTLVNESSGARMRAGFIFIVDLASGTVIVQRGAGACVHE